MAGKRTARTLTTRSRARLNGLPARPEDRGELFRRFARCLEPEELETAILEALAARLPGPRAMVSLDPSSREPTRVLAGRGTRPWPRGEPVPPLLAVPIEDGGEPQGWVAWEDGPAVAGPARSVARDILLEVAAAAGLPARNARRFRRALELALRDPLTGLFNRRAFETFLAREREWAVRSGRPLSLVLADLDRFKEINDVHGHPAGDRALVHFGRLLAGTARRSDIAARVGGDEFALLLPETSPVDAARLAERVRHRLALSPLDPPGTRLSASFGVAGIADAGGDPDRLVRLADDALYAAKRAGRDRLHRWIPREDGPPAAEETR